MMRRTFGQRPELAQVAARLSIRPQQRLQLRQRAQRHRRRQRIACRGGHAQRRQLSKHRLTGQLLRSQMEIGMSEQAMIRADDAGVVPPFCRR